MTVSEREPTANLPFDSKHFFIEDMSPQICKRRQAFTATAAFSLTTKLQSSTKQAGRPSAH